MKTAISRMHLSVRVTITQEATIRTIHLSVRVTTLRVTILAPLKFCSFSHTRIRTDIVARLQAL